MADKTSLDEKAWQKLHEEACTRGERSYHDPKTGLTVLTRIEHLARGYCCESGCRHCPYNNKSQA